VSTAGASPTLATPLSRGGLLARATVATVIAGAVLLPPLLASGVWNQRIALAAIYAIIGLSVNVLTGHAGQISLGHQAFVGIGAFMTAYLVSVSGVAFPAAVAFAAATGAVMAAALGLAALRIRGLYLALVTLAFGLAAEATLFNWRAFTGGGAGALAPRPSLFATDMAYAYLCLGILALVLLLDWRLVRTKAGRALTAVRNDERMAASLGVDVTGYKLLAFVLSGTLAGLAGALFAHWNQVVQARDFDFQIALVWVLMAVVGGLRSRAGVVIMSAFFALLPTVLPQLLTASPVQPPFVNEAVYHVLPPFVAVVLLLITLTLVPGGVGALLLPLRRWLAGSPLRRPAPVREPEPAPEGPAGTESAEVRR
jgi:branched-chain amino acid transport system permease protein